MGVDMNYRSIDTVEEIVDEECYVVDQHIVIAKWAVLERVCIPFFKITESDIKERQSKPRCINAVFDACDGILITESLQVMTAYTGDAHGGQSKLYVEQEGRQQPYLPVLAVGNSVEAVVEAFYATFELPKKGCFWHGLYGRDYSLLLYEQRLVAAMERRRSVSSDRCEREETSRPCGIRLVKHRNSYQLSCLASYPNGKIVDMSLSIDGGQISAKPEEVVLPATCLHLY